MRVVFILSRYRMSYGDKIANINGGGAYMREVKGTHWKIETLEEVTLSRKCGSSFNSRHRTVQNTKEKVFYHVSLYSLVDACPNIPTFRLHMGMLYNRTECCIICIIVKSIQNCVSQFFLQ